MLKLTEKLISLGHLAKQIPNFSVLTCLQTKLNRIFIDKNPLNMNKINFIMSKIQETQQTGGLNLHELYPKFNSIEESELISMIKLIKDIKEEVNMKE